MTPLTLLLILVFSLANSENLEHLENCVICETCCECHIPIYDTDFWPPLSEIIDCSVDKTSAELMEIRDRDGEHAAPAIEEKRILSISSTPIPQLFAENDVYYDSAGKRSSTPEPHWRSGCETGGWRAGTWNCYSPTFSRTLDFSNNRLQSFPSGVFNQLTTLNSLFLSGNKISELPPDIFVGLINLQFLDISNNPWPCIPRICVTKKWSHDSHTIGQVVGREEDNQFWNHRRSGTSTGTPGVGSPGGHSKTVICNPIEINNERYIVSGDQVERVTLDRQHGEYVGAVVPQDEIMCNCPLSKDPFLGYSGAYCDLSCTSYCNGGGCDGYLITDSPQCKCLMGNGGINCQMNCSQCPTNNQCSVGGVAAAVANPCEPVVCAEPTRCLANGSCISGSTGPGCSNCISDPPHFEIGNRCQPCPSWASWILWVIVCTIIIIGFYFLHENIDNTTNNVDSLKILIVYFQIQLLHLKIDIPWPQMLLDIMTWLEALLFLSIPEITSIECIFSFSYPTKWILAFFTTPVSLGLFLVARICSNKDTKHSNKKLIRIIYIIISSSYLYTTLVTVTPWDCTNLSDNNNVTDYTLDVSPQVHCSTENNQWVAMFILSIIGIPSYVYGIPMISQILQIRLEDLSKYKSGSEGYESVSMWLKAFEVFLYVFTTSKPVLMICLSICIQSVTLSCLVNTKPYKKEHHYQKERLLLVNTIFQLVIGLLTYSNLINGIITTAGILLSLLANIVIWVSVTRTETVSISGDNKV